jgi:hypothetical protein
MAASAAALHCRVDHVETAARQRVLTQKVVARCKQLELTAAWNSWQEVVGGWAVAAWAATGITLNHSLQPHCLLQAVVTV